MVEESCEKREGLKSIFTQMPGYAGEAEIKTDKELTVYMDLSRDVPIGSVYKITGVHGSGKTVLYTRILNHYQTKEALANGWLFIDIPAASDPVIVLGAALAAKRNLIQRYVTTDIEEALSLFSFGSNAKSETDIASHYLALETLLKAFIAANKKIIVGIDDIKKTPAIVKFLALFAQYRRNCIDPDINPAPWPIYFICTGVYQNLAKLDDTDVISYFSQAVEITTNPLSVGPMSGVYMDALGVSRDKAVELAQLTKGLAYAYQLIGKNWLDYSEKGQDYVLEKTRQSLCIHCYDKIWSELSPNERLFMKELGDGPLTYREMTQKMGDKKKNYNAYSRKLRNIGLLKKSDVSYGICELALPFFDEYMKIYC